MTVLMGLKGYDGTEGVKIRDGAEGVKLFFHFYLFTGVYLWAGGRVG